jgi:predicted Mrr-cat superfamily restriction endonuclease
MNVWRLVITHKSDPKPMLEWAKKNGRIAIGWGLIGSIKDNRYYSPQDISDAIKKYYPGLSNAGHGGASLYSFYCNVQYGDLVILTKVKRYLVMEVTGDYEFNKSDPTPSGDYQHQREAKVLPINTDKLWQLAGATHAEGHNFYWTLCKLQNPINEQIKAVLMG